MKTECAQGPDGKLPYIYFLHIHDGKKDINGRNNFPTNRNSLLKNIPAAQYTKMFRISKKF